MDGASAPAPRVTVGYCFGPDGKVTQAFAESLMGARIHDLEGPRLIDRVLSAGGLYIAQNRNDVAAWFLEGDADALLFFDDDMAFGPDIVEVMAGLLDEEHQVVGALYFGYGPKERIHPIVLDEDENGVAHLASRLELGALRRVAAVGMGCTIIGRRVLEDLSREPFGRGTFEDVEFCKAARAAGYPVWHYTGIALGHVKHRLVTIDTFRAQPEVRLEPARTVEEALA